MAQDPYSELGVKRGATADEIRRAFRKLAKQFHPDANPGDKASEERFKRISGAFDILGDPEKKAKFDRGDLDNDGRETMRGGFAGSGFGGQGFGPRGSQPGEGYGRSAQFEDVDISDILGQMFGGGANPGASRQRGGFGFGGAQKGADVRARLDIDIEDAIAGGKQRISFSDGRVIDVMIPKGAVEGQVLRLKGQGQTDRGGAGDALIEIGIRPHPIYRREGDSLVMDLPISAPDAILGGKVTAPTPDGAVSLTVPKGANSGQTLRLKGRGLPDPKTGVRGDLLARLVVTLPDASDEELTQFAEAWRRDRPYTPRRKG